MFEDHCRESRVQRRQSACLKTGSVSWAKKTKLYKKSKIKHKTSSSKEHFFLQNVSHLNNAIVLSLHFLLSLCLPLYMCVCVCVCVCVWLSTLCYTFRFFLLSTLIFLNRKSILLVLWSNARSSKETPLFLSSYITVMTTCLHFKRKLRVLSVKRVSPQTNGI